ncbi:MAG TPA: menaquinone biosynthesis protein [Bacteroidales bacterium]|jgi:chorismate dehydratase|nr:menaquinone biosynthesis protein [Bacteroidales bacterium]
MEKIRISAVRYANTYPFIYGLTECGFDRKADLKTDHPSDCAEKIISAKADLGLIPVGAIPFVNEPFILSDYCIGANGKVRTVQMMGNSCIEKIDRVYLDFRSRTSVRLIKVLAEKYWNRRFIWEETSSGFDFASISGNEAVVLIGDQCFELENNYEYKWDLAEEWKKFTGLPFVFACWVANKALPDAFLNDFNDALSLGVNNIDLVTEKFSNTGPITGRNLERYLKENIDFILDREKRKAMDLFFKFLKET